MPIPSHSYIFNFTLFRSTVVVLMVETIEEFVEEVKTLRSEMQANGNTADNMMLASWLDRLLLSIEKVSPTIALMAIELEELSLNEKPREPECSCCEELPIKQVKKSTKKPTKKAKAKKKKKR
jgi:hypothetical protein